MNDRGAGLTARELAARAVRGSVSVAASSYLGFLLSILGTAGIARFVGPAEFGAYALGQAYAQTLVALGAFAFTQSVLQSDRESMALADTALVMTLGVRLAVFLVALPVSIAISHLQGATVARIFLQLSAIQMLDAARVGMGMPLQRRLDYGTFASVNLACSVIGHSTGVAAAFVGWGASSLVLRDALLAVVGVGIYLFGARRWKLPTGRHLDRDAAREAWRFGASVFLVRAIDQGLARMDRVILGALLPLASVGCYQQARYVATLPSAAVAPGNLSVAVGMYSRVRHNREHLSKAFDTVQYFVVRVIPPFAILCAAWPDLVIVGLLGSKWALAQEPLRAAAAYALLLPVLDSYRALMEALQKWRVLRWSSVIQATAAIIAIVGLSRFGAVGAAAGLVIGCAASVAFLVGISRRLVSSDLMRRYLPVVVSTGVTLMCAFAIRAWIGTRTSQTVLVVGATLTIVVYAAILIAVEAAELRERARYVLEMLRGRQRRSTIAAE